MWFWHSYHSDGLQHSTVLTISFKIYEGLRVGATVLTLNINIWSNLLKAYIRNATNLHIMPTKFYFRVLKR